MNDRDWNRVDGLLEAALERDPIERAAFLREACAGDDVLRLEVESLLAHASSASGFLSTPAVAGGLSGSTASVTQMNTLTLIANSTAPEASLLVGRTLGSYRIDARLGAGGMGVVYRATDLRLDRVVAIKILMPHVPGDSALRRQFEQEARAIAALRHPHICVLHDVGEEDGIAFLVMEYLEGDTLAARLARGPFTKPEIIRYAFEIADALAETHRRGVVHGDLKPGNVMLTQTGAKLLDFGLATLLQRNEERAREFRAGTLAYMAPEQLAGTGVVDARSDIFAFGATVFEMVTGNRASDTAALAEALEDTGASRALQHLIVKCLAPDAQQRYSEAAELRQELSAIRAASEPHGWRYRWVVAAAVLALAVAMSPLLASARQMLERRAVRATLDEVAARGLPPERVNPGWASLATGFRTQVREDPHGTVADLGRLAAIRVVARLGAPPLRVTNINSSLWEDPTYAPPSVSYARVSRLPAVNLFVSQLFPLGVSLHALVDLEVETPQGQWVRLGWAEVVRTSGTDSGRTAVCSFRLPAGVAVPGQATLKFRAALSFRDALESEDSFGMTSRCSPMDKAGAIRKELSARPVITQTARMLDPITFSVYDEYPDNLPEEIKTDGVAERASEFSPARISLVQARAPGQKTGTALMVKEGWPAADRLRLPVCAPASSTAGVLMGIEVHGTFTEAPAVPVAARLSWRPEDTAAPLLMFPIVAGGGYFGFDGPNRLQINAAGMLSPLASGLQQQPSDVTVSLRRTPSATSIVLQFSNPVWLTRLLTDELVPGVIDVLAARDLALSNYFEKYQGSFTRPAPLEVRTLSADWIQTPSCASSSISPVTREGR